MNDNNKIMQNNNNKVTITSKNYQINMTIKQNFIEDV